MYETADTILQPLQSEANDADLVQSQSYPVNDDGEVRDQPDVLTIKNRLCQRD